MIDRLGQDPEDWDLEAVVREAQRGNRRAFDVLCERCSDMVFRTVYGFLGDYGLAQEVTQDVFVKVYRKLPTCRQPAKFISWLLTIATNESRNALRGKKNAWWRRRHSYEEAIATGLERPATDPQPPDQAITHEQQQVIRQAVHRLSPELREVIVLHYYVDMTYEEIADVLNCPIGTVKSRLHTARAKLEKDLGGQL
jgi:RNA polymerase sigma-70 factor (ECF subfamily)